VGHAAEHEQADDLAEAEFLVQLRSRAVTESGLPTTT